MTESRLRRSIRILRRDESDQCECGTRLDSHPPLRRYGPMSSGASERRRLDPVLTTDGKPRQKSIPGVDYQSTPAQRAFGEQPIGQGHANRRVTDVARV